MAMKKSLLFGRKRTRDLTENHLSDEVDAKKDELLALKLKAMHAVAQSSGKLMELPVALLRADPNQPRKRFDNLVALAESIKAKGVIQPIVVTNRDDNGMYTIIVGERRFRAAKMAGLKVLPCIIRHEDDVNTLMLQLLENDQREGVSPMAESNALIRLVEEMGVSKSRLAHELGRDAAWVSLRLGLQHASEAVKQLVEEGVIEDARTLHELRKLASEKPKVAESLIEKLRNNQVSGSYRQVIAAARKKSNSSAAIGKTRKAQRIAVKNGQLLVYTGGKHPVVYDVAPEVLEALVAEIG